MAVQQNASDSFKLSHLYICEFSADAYEMCFCGAILFLKTLKREFKDAAVC